MDTDAERIERLRELWAKFRFHIVCGLAMVLAAVGGFSWDTLSRQAERRAANEALFRVLLAAREERPEAAEAAFAELQSDSYPDLRNLGAFAVADQRFQGGDAEGAEAALREILDGSEDDGLRDLAALRLAEVLTQRGRYEEAETLLNQRVPNQGSARILFQDRLGDAAALRGDTDAALAAYRQAENQARRDFPNYLPLLEFKIGALLAGIEVAAVDDDSDSDSDSESASEAATNSESESGANLESTSGANADSESSSTTDAESESSSTTDVDSESSSTTDVDSESPSTTGADSESDSTDGANTNSDSTSGVDANVNTDSDSTSGTDSDSASDSNLDSESEADGGGNANTNSESEAADGAGSQ